MSGYLELEGKRALVTGGTKGVGEAVVAALREAGATALTTARSRPESLSNTEHFVVADVSTVEGCAAVADAVRDRLGGIDMPYKFDRLLGFAINSDPGFWLKNGEVAKDLYVAFTAKSADAVRASYKAAIDVGATSIKEPSLRPEWRADYFAANIGDPDGYNIEIAYKPWLYK